MMASYMRDIERLSKDGSLPPLRSSTSLTQAESRRVNFEDDYYRSPRPISPRARSPTGGYMGRESPLFQPRPPSPGRRSLQDIQDQVKHLKDELQRKDSLIQQLVSTESVTKVQSRSTVDSIRLETLNSLGDRQHLDACRSELAALQVRSEKQQNKIRELENELEIRDVKIRELQMQMETGRDNECRLQSLVESLRSQVSDLEGRAGAFESVAGRSEITVAALQKENKAAQERIVDLETRQRKQLEEREEAQARVEILDHRMRDYFSQFASVLRVETSGKNASAEEIARKLQEIIDENSCLKGKILTLNETLNSTQLESKASRETIMRLVSEMGREQQNQSRFENERASMKSRSREPFSYYDEQPLRSSMKRSLTPTRHGDHSVSPPRYHDYDLSRELDKERGAKVGLEREITILRERLDASQRTIDAQRNEIDLRDSRLKSLDHDLRSNKHHQLNASTQLTLFREHIAKLLGDVDARDEEALTRRVETLALYSRDYRFKIEALEKRIKELTDQLESQYELHKAAASRARKAEVEAADMHQRLKNVESDLVAGDVMRDGFRTDKERYMRCLQLLGEAMKMDRISLDLGMDMTCDALIARAEQLVKLEKDALADRSTHIYNLQRKVKSCKEQLESKDLHIDLLRKKITALEEKLLGKSTIERERDSESLRVRKAEKMAEKYKIQVQDARQEVTNLKAQLLGSSELKVRTLEQRKELEELAKTVDELEKLRRKQASKIRELKSEIDTSNQASQEKRVVADNAVQALTSELRTTKTALSTIQSREKQLLDFRSVVSRMLGLDINTLAIPDYEIISQLEKLIQAHHSHTFTTLSLEEALADMEDGFFSGYSDYKNTVGASESMNIRKSRERVKRKALKNRARSLSPQRRIDPKVY
ncbi:LOW QUALITY PROTEIN: coiled-coil domain-containing protein 170-like [Dreissena polymorpha]|nr:LOW QUALITY PROTEIN: coiled-coil domain-containing protein 170-like [Dreissena polymorpha]